MSPTDDPSSLRSLRRWRAVGNRRLAVIDSAVGGLRHRSIAFQLALLSIGNFYGTDKKPVAGGLIFLWLTENELPGRLLAPPTACC